MKYSLLVAGLLSAFIPVGALANTKPKFAKTIHIQGTVYNKGDKLRNTALVIQRNSQPSFKLETKTDDEGNYNATFENNYGEGRFSVYLPSSVTKKDTYINVLPCKTTSADESCSVGRKNLHFNF